MISIELSPNAFTTLDEISDFLLELWSFSVVEDYISLIDDANSKIQKFLYSGKPFTSTIRKIVLHKNASLFYEYDENIEKITILLFIDNSSNPKDYLKLL
jgi:plasmid stabilization system protein ParE